MSLSITQAGANDLAQALVGPGVTISNVTFVGNAAQGGTFSGGLSAGGLDHTGAQGIGFDTGVVLSSGRVADIAQPASAPEADTGFSGAGDADLTAIAGAPTNDASILSFDFNPGSSSQIFFNFVFSTSEYPSSPGFNDAFAILVNGTNVALIPGDGTGVALSNFNSNTNNNYYKVNSAATPDNPDNFPSQSINNDIQSLSVVIRATAAVTPNQVNHIKFAVADSGDDAVDSFVFVQGGSLSTTQVPASLAVPAGLTLDAASDSGVIGDNLTNVAHPTITGSATANSTVNLYVGSTLVGTGMADSAGNFAITPTVALSQGNNSLTATATDGTGTPTASSTPLVVKLDSVAPATPSALALAAGSDSGISLTDNQTKVTTPTLTGTAEAGAAITLYDTDGTTVLGTTTANGAGHWSLTSTALSDGNHTLTAKAVDAAGNVGAASSGLSITIDTAAPSVTAITPHTTGSTNATTLTETVTFSKAVSGVTASAFTLHDANGNVVPGTIGTPTTSDGGLTYTVTVSGLTGDGTVHLDLNASGTGITDTAGNALAGGGVTGTSVTLDHGVPAISLAFSAGSGAANHALATDAATGALVLNAAEFASGFYLGGTSSDTNPGLGARVIFFASDGHLVAAHDAPFVNGQFAFHVDAPGTVGGLNAGLAAALVDGTYTVIAATQDAAGNIGHTVAQTLVIDTTADAGRDAALTIDDTTDHVINAAEARAVGFTVAGLDADATAVATFTDGTHTLTAAVGANGAGTADLTGFNGMVTSSLAITDAHQNIATVVGGAAQINTAVPVLSPVMVAGTGVANTLSGNVLGDGAGGSPLHLASVQASDGTITTVERAGTTPVAGAHGTLTIAADGSYSYQAHGHGHDVFTETVMDAAGNATLTTLTFDVAAQVSQAFRFYDAATGAHVFTTDANEAAQIQANLPTLQAEATPWTTPDAGTDTIDVFRFYDTVTHDHFLTTDVAERDAIQANLPTFQYEGIAFQAYASEGASGTEVLERFYNTLSKTHMYALAAEADGIRHGSSGTGWIDEGKAFVVHVGTDAHA